MAPASALAVLAVLANSTANGTDSSVLTPMPSRDAVTDAKAAAEAAAREDFLKDFSRKIFMLEVFILLGYLIMSMLSIALILYLRYNRHEALKGDATAARKMLLPAFEPLFWILGLVTLVYAIVVVVAMALGTFEQNVSTTATEGFHCGRMFVFLVVFAYMMQKSVTVPALVRSVAISFVLAIYSLPVQIVVSYYDTDTPASKRRRHILMTSVRALVLILFTYIFVHPPGRASKRSLREYVVFVYGYYICSWTYNQLLYMGHLDEGFIMVYVTCIWASLAPLFIWRVLNADTQHWRGMGQRAVSLQSLFRQKHNLNERVSSQGLHVLIEMHRKLVIDFAYLELKHKIGMGSSAVVFNGVLHSKTPVAIKVYTPSEFDEDIVAAFSQEAALCGALNHPNIVKFYGMCVCPPTICLVSELCQGSLDDITTTIATHHQHPHRQQQLINLSYMLDAARAVAYIHSFSPTFVHRDIKPSNFLVDVDNTVKLTDFGESRSLPKSHVMTPPVAGSTVNPSTAAASKTTISMMMKSGASIRQSSLVSDTPAKMTVKGTVDYMAPEIIQGRAGIAQYGEAADVYSLAITMWDILNPGKEKFPTIRNNHLHIFESVVDGKRPALDHGVHPSLRAVIESAWHGDPRMRPSAQNIVNIVEAVQEECFAVFAADLGDELEMQGTYNKYGEVVAKTFSAHHAIDRMEELNFVLNQAEAVRLGNALMDAGLMHHSKHERPFEVSEASYFLDEDNINLCQPILVPGEEEDDREEEGEGEEEEDDDVDPHEHVDHLVPLPQSSALHRVRGSGGRSRHGIGGGGGSLPRRKNSTTTTTGRTVTTANRSDPALYDNGMCPCRKLGQRLEQPKGGTGGRRRFRRHHRNKAVSEENLLTAKLLGAEVMPLPATHDFDEFDAVHAPFQQHRDPEAGEGGLA